MTALSRAGWILSAALFATLLLSILHVDYSGTVPAVLLVAIAIMAAARPERGIQLVALITPVAWWFAVQYWNWTVAWPEAVVCAALTGLSIDAALRVRPLPFSLSAPIGLIVTLIVASMVAGLGVTAIRLGPSFTDAVITHLTREHFVDVRGFPALHAGLRLLEGILLFALAARVAFTPEALRLVAIAVTAGACGAALLNVLTLIQKAMLREHALTALIDLTRGHRWNVHYGDFNAAGSYFILALFIALALLARAGRLQRFAATGCVIIIAAALWLTSSRVAFLAGLLAPVAMAVLAYLLRGRAYALRAAAIGAGAVVLVILVALALPQRGSQQSPWLSADVRFGLMQTTARMIAARPVFGIGLGEFYQRSAEFSSRDLLVKFPFAHENAHNNILQVAAELGLTGGVFFTWLVSAGLIAAGRRVAASRDLFLGLVLMGLVAFVLTLLGGHPLLVAEPGFLFWTTFGAAAGCCTAAAAGAPAARSGLRGRWIVVTVALAIVITLPWRMKAMLQDADLEHVGIGVSSVWQTAPDGVRYREATGYATLFAPTGTVTFRVNPRADRAVRLEVKLEGRVADVRTAEPNTWSQVMLPARTQRPTSRYARIDIRVVDGDQTTLWVTKVEPIK